MTNHLPRGDLPVLGFADPAAWESWLAGQHSLSSGVWLKIPVKGSGRSGVSDPEALEVALCHGWIDGQKDRLDDDYWLQRFTPREPGSRWSKINTENPDLARPWPGADPTGGWRPAAPAPGGALVPSLAPGARAPGCPGPVRC